MRGFGVRYAALAAMAGVLALTCWAPTAGACDCEGNGWEMCYDCYLGEWTYFCAPLEACCLGACLDPITERCCEDFGPVGYTCLKNHGCCRGDCCEPGAACCGSGTGRFCCTPQTPNCCDGACYNSGTDRCCDDKGGQNDGYACPIGTTCCKGDCCEPNECCLGEECIKVEIAFPFDANKNGWIDDAGQEFAFSGATPGVLQIGCSASGGPASDPAGDKFRWTMSGIGSVQGVWDPHVDGNPYMGKGCSSTVTFTGMPVNNGDFGRKTITLSYVGVSCDDAVEVEVFFAPVAQNNPGPEPDDMPAGINLSEVIE